MMNTYQNINTINQLRGFIKIKQNSVIDKAAAIVSCVLDMVIWCTRLSPPVIKISLLLSIRWQHYTTLCDNVCQWLTAGRWFSPGPRVSSTNTTDCYDITEILLKVALNTIKPNFSMLVFAFHVHFTLSNLSPSIIPPKHSQQILTLNTHEIKIRSVIHKHIF